MPRGVYEHRLHTKAEKENISEVMVGRKFSEKHRENLSKGCREHSGVYERTEWHKKRISEGRNGMKFSIKHRKNMSEANIKRFEKSEEREKLSKIMNSVKVKKKIAEALMGRNNPSWQGGVSFEPYSPEFNEQLKEFIRKRDNYACQFPGCNAKQNGKAFCSHHIDYDKESSNPMNLILLCPSCNSKVNFNREYWQNYFQNLMIGEKNEKFILEKRQV